MGLAPKTEFVRRGDGDLAYQVFGDGPARVLEINGYASHREQLWQFPIAVRAMERLARMACVAQYDWRGYGMSDALPGRDYPIEELAADALAVLDAAEFEQAVLWGHGPGGAIAIWLAVQFPERVTGLILDNASASMRARPGYDIGFTDAEVAEFRPFFETMWGTGASLDLIASRFADDDRVRADWARYERIAATPSSILAVAEIAASFDVRHLLSDVAVPTLVLHSATNIVIPAAHGRYLADHIPGARYFESDEDAALEWDSADLGGEVSEFLTGSRSHAHVERSLLVVLFTDIAASTDRVAAVGDTAWRETLDSFRRLVRRLIDRYGAREVNTRGDDFFAVASNPSIAIAIARDIRSEAETIGLQVRTGIHLGEVEHQGDDYTGLSVHIGARIAALATPGEILISQTVRDALVGSLVHTTSRGTHPLKGVPDEWTLYAVEP
jgi:class 3 adenylate cyclase/alpha-beta hydrolase superfamily lysophospholipase